MKINSMRAFLISALIIIILYSLGLFLPIIMTSKKVSKLFINYEIRLILKEKTTFL